MKKLISIVLSLALFMSLFALIPVSADAAVPTLASGNTDTITVDADAQYLRGSESEHLIISDYFNSAYADVNDSVVITKVCSTWKWVNTASGFYEDFAAVGEYVYSAHPYTPMSLNVPEISVKVAANTAVSFKVAMRNDVADWNDVKVSLSDDNKVWKDASGVTDYTAKEYAAQNSATEYGKKFTVRFYTVNIYEESYLKVQLPLGDEVLQAISDKGMNSDAYNFCYSAVMMTPFTAAASDSLAAGTNDSLTVDTASGAIANFTGKTYFYNSQISSLADVNDGVAAVKIEADNWRWLKSANAFYTEVVSTGTWVYSANEKSPAISPQVIYKVKGGTVVSFKVALRKELASWDAVTAEVCSDGSNYYTPSSNFFTYTEKEYACDYGTMSVRTYELLVPADGKLRITLPMAQTIMDNTLSTGLNGSNEAFTHASAMVIPASASEAVLLESGDADSIADDISGWKSSLKTTYGTFTGGTNVSIPTINSSYKWGNSDGDVTYLLPELATNKAFLVDGKNPFSLTYNVAGGTTFVLPVIMKESLWNVLTDTNNIVFTVDDSTGTKTITPEYIKTESKWSYKSDNNLVLRKYSVYCESNTVVNISMSAETTAILATAAYAINTGGDYLNSCALVAPAYGLDKINQETITNGSNAYNIYDNIYFRANAITSDSYAVSGGVTVSKVTSDWHWWLEDTRFFDMVAAADEYVYTTAYDKDIDPEIYYAFEEAATVSFKVGITEGIASWDNVKAEFSVDGINWTDAEIRWLEDSFSTLYANGECPMNVRFYEANIPTGGYLRITLPNGMTSATNWNTAINTNNKLLGCCVFATGISVKDGCFTVGDLDGDLNKSGLDLAMLRKILLNNEFVNCGDINSDHLIDVRDLVRLKKECAGIYESAESDYFNGMSALYLGDSISYGATDNNPGVAWCGRIESLYGLEGTNVSKSGWCLAEGVGDRGVISTQLDGVTASDYDYIIMQGGVNDVWNSATLGTVTAEGTTEFDAATIAGGLESLFYTAKQQAPDAKLGFIINFRIKGVFREEGWNEFVTVAEQICEKWDVACLNLTDNEEFNAVFDTYVYTTDKVHPNASGYEILSKFIGEWIKTF